MRHGVTARNPGVMENTFRFADDTVRFEIPSLEHVSQLQKQIARKRAAWSGQDGDIWTVEAEVTAAEDLAGLLREIETWVAKHQLGAIRYHLDGRAYILSSGEAPWSEFRLDQPDSVSPCPAARNGYRLES